MISVRRRDPKSAEGPRAARAQVVWPGEKRKRKKLLPTIIIIIIFRPFVVYRDADRINYAAVPARVIYYVMSVRKFHPDVHSGPGVYIYIYGRNERIFDAAAAACRLRNFAASSGFFHSFSTVGG